MDYYMTIIYLGQVTITNVIVIKSFIYYFFFLLLCTSKKKIYCKFRKGNNIFRVGPRCFGALSELVYWDPFSFVTYNLYGPSKTINFDFLTCGPGRRLLLSALRAGREYILVDRTSYLT